MNWLIIIAVICAVGGILLGFFAGIFWFAAGSAIKYDEGYQEGYKRGYLNGVTAGYEKRRETEEND